MFLIVCAYLQHQLRRLGERIGGDADRFEELARSHIGSFPGFLYHHVCVSVGLSRVTRCVKLRVASAQQLHVSAAIALPVGKLITCRFEAQPSEQLILQREKEET